ncbi:MAG: F0F1 ATP synthase subunit A [Planctomycetes bacterium]|nr:F0F1 ATP synthase subunit A [Planctomycetota bacterium]
MIAALLSSSVRGAIAGGDETHAPPATFFTPLWRAIKDQGWAKWFGFDNPDRHLGQLWFEAICFSTLAGAALILLALAATRRYERVPRGLQNLFELAVSLLRSFVRGFTGPSGDRYVPFLGTVFLFIFLMNLLGIVPGFRAPTMTLSTTAALGLTTFVAVQIFAIRDAGPVSYLSHFTGGVSWKLLPIFLLMIVVEIIGELAKPMSLSLRLFGNIFGEDNVIEQLMTLGGWIPVQLPMLAFAIFTSFLQAFIFTALATIYISSKVVHEEHGAEAPAH